MPQQSSQAAKLTTEQSDFVKETLAEFDAENLTERRRAKYSSGI